MDDLQVYIGRKIKSLRAMKGWTQQDLQQASGIGQRYISRYEHGKWTAINPCHLCKLASALGVSLDDLAGRNGRAT